MILALETSCDDTCAAVVTRAGEIRSNIISSQGVHSRFGGVVPEWASRHHLEQVNAIVDEALDTAGTSLDEIELIAVTQGPGLVGALLIGVATAKGLAAARRLPLAAVDHLQGHVAANYLGDEPFEPPFICLLASGGHTLLARVTDHAGYEQLGQTLDDAAGEAFDKGARLLGLGYPGGPALSKLATEGDPSAFKFPVASRLAGLDFSFAGLKTALLYKVRDLGPEETTAPRRRPRRQLRARDRRSADHPLRARPGGRERAAAGDRRRRRGQPPAARARAGPRRPGPRAGARAVHRQRGDDRLRRALGRAAALPGLPRARRLRDPPHR